MNYIASIIIPIRVKRPFSNEIRRLRRLLKTVPQQFEIIIVDDGSSSRAGKFINYLTDQYLHVKYVYLKTKYKKFSLSRARNYGAEVSSSDVVIFHDVDFLGSVDMYQQIEKEITERELSKKPENFFCIPVAFLTDTGTKEYLCDLKDNINKKYWSFIEHPNEPSKDVSFIVQGSSCIICNRDHLLSIGGHDQRYKGHGAEDFELLHRLSMIFPKAELPPEYSTNTKSGFIKEYRGFRAYFALYGEECKAKGIVLVHLYHPKRQIRLYYKHRKNFKMLKQLMEKDENRIFNSCT